MISIYVILPIIIVYLICSCLFIGRLKKLPKMLGQKENSFYKKYLFRRLRASVYGLCFIISIFFAINSSAVKGNNSTNSKTNTELIIALDVSNSMLTQTGNSNRLESAISFISQLVYSMPESRISLICFKGDAIIMCPPTFDRKVFEEALAYAKPNIISSPGTSISKLIEKVLAMEIQKETNCTLLIFSDGNDTIGDTENDLNVLKSTEIKTAFIGFGDNKSRFAYDSFGNAIKNSHGENVKTTMNENALQEWASISLGTFIDANSPKAFSKLILFCKENSLNSYSNIRSNSINSSFYVYLSMIFLALSFYLSSSYPRKKNNNEKK